MNLSKAFSILWRLAMLALPWQTVFLFRTGTLNGFDWAQGTVGLYISQILLLLTILAGAWLFTDAWKQLYAKAVRQKYALIAVGVLIVSSLFTASWLATLLWWGSAIVLAAFIATLYFAGVNRRSIAMWFVIALIPQALIGIYQYLTQDLLGSTLLGIAEHRPWTSGTSVVEHGLYRVLRAYGGFPHPNILGGYMAVGLALLPDLVQSVRGKLGKVAYVFAGSVFAITLVFTYSRGAWVAATVGLILALVFAWKSARDVLDKQGIALLAVVILMSGVFGVVTQWDHVKTRFHTNERLEHWSLEQRATAEQEGVAAATLRPLTGWGPGAALVGISSVRTDESLASVKPEPPHNLPTLILLETGILGFAAVLYLVWLLLGHIVRELSTTDCRLPTVPLILTISALAATDHYLWSLWPGLVLVAIVVSLLTNREKSIKEV